MPRVHYALFPIHRPLSRCFWKKFSDVIILIAALVIKAEIVLVNNNIGQCEFLDSRADVPDNVGQQNKQCHDVGPTLNHHRVFAGQGGLSLGQDPQSQRFRSACTDAHQESREKRPRASHRTLAGTECETAHTRSRW